jgi:hypothetical protein
MRRYSMVLYDTIINTNYVPNSNLKSERSQYLKRFIMYDHYDNEFVSMPVMGNSDEHFDLMDTLLSLNDYHVAEFRYYNKQLQFYINEQLELFANETN